MTVRWTVNFWQIGGGFYNILKYNTLQSPKTSRKWAIVCCGPGEYDGETSTIKSRAMDDSDIYPRLVYDVGHSTDREYEGGEA